MRNKFLQNYKFKNSCSYSANAAKIRTWLSGSEKPLQSCRELFFSVLYGLSKFVLKKFLLNWFVLQLMFVLKCSCLKLMFPNFSFWAETIFYESFKRLTEEDFDSIISIEIRWDEYVDREEISMREVLENWNIKYII